MTYWYRGDKAVDRRLKTGKGRKYQGEKENRGANGENE